MKLQETINQIKANMPAPRTRFGVILQFKGQGIGAGCFDSWKHAYDRAVSNAAKQGYNLREIQHVRLLSSIV